MIAFLIRASKTRCILRVIQNNASIRFSTTLSFTTPAPSSQFTICDRDARQGDVGVGGKTAKMIGLANHLRLSCYSSFVTLRSIPTVSRKLRRRDFSFSEGSQVGSQRVQVIRILYDAFYTCSY